LGPHVQNRQFEATWRLLLASSSSQPFVRLSPFHSPLAPPIHPASSCPQQWWLVMVPGGLLVAVSSPPCCSPLPPREQLLTAVVQGAAVVTIVVGPGVVALALAVGINTHDPPCEQLLTGVGAGAVSSVTIGGCCSRLSLSWGHRGDEACFFGSWGVWCNVACLWVCLDTYLAGTLLYRPPSSPLQPPSPSQDPHILFEWGGGGVWPWCVSSRFWLLPVV
jgi:hypothetical protein